MRSNFVLKARLSDCRHRYEHSNSFNPHDSQTSQERLRAQAASDFVDAVNPVDQVRWCDQADRTVPCNAITQLPNPMRLFLKMPELAPLR